jgi:hypothetical protein
MDGQPDDGKQPHLDGYDVNHAWGEGGHNQKHASQIFPDVLRWPWRDWPTTIEIQGSPKNESKWKGHAVVGQGSGRKRHEVKPITFK